MNIRLIMQNKLNLLRGNKKILLLGIVVLIFLNIVLRFPIMPHEMGSDSFFIHELGQSIVDSGFINWSSSPLSLIGFYPNSYASGVPTFIAISSQICDFDMETTIFFVSLFFGIFGVFSAYLLAGEFSDKTYFRYMVALIYSTAPIVLTFTLWTISTRGLFMVMLPLVIWAILRFFDRKEAKYLLLFCVLTSGLIATHKMFIIIVPILACIITAYFVYRFFKNNPPAISKSMRTKLPWVYFSALAVLFIIPFFFNHSIWGLRYFPGSGDTWYVYAMKTFLSVGMLYRFILILAGLGAFFVIKNNFEKRVHCIFLLILILLSVPLCTQTFYIPDMVLIFFSILAGYGILFILTLLKKVLGSEKSLILLIILIISLLLISSSLPRLINFNESGHNNYGSYMYDETFHLALFIQKETMNLPVSGSNRQLDAFVRNPNDPLTIINSNNKQTTSILKPFPTNINALAHFIQSPFSITSSKNSLPIIYAYKISLKNNVDISMDTPDKIKIYSNGFEEVWRIDN